MTQALRSPMAEDTGPPKDWFLGEEWFARDLAAVFRPRWVLAGHLAEMSGPGQYLTFSLGSDEVLICKDVQGRIYAYHNVCSHRGARLCHSTGKLGTRIVCPYHGWTYSLSDGALLTAPHMHEDFDRAAWGLRPAHVDVWFGLIFVSLADEPPPPMATYMGAVHFGGYNFAEAKLACTKTHEIRANWKIVVENNLECYHCAINHPELVAIRDWKTTGLLKAMDAANFDNAVKARLEGLEVIETTIACSHTINGKRICTVPFPRRDSEPEPPAYAVLWEPGLAMLLSRDHGWIFSPKPTGPDRTELKQYWFVAPAASDGKDYNTNELREFWDTTMQQDRVICENVQKGMELRSYVPGPLNRVHQIGQAGFYAWYVHQIQKHFPSKVHFQGKSDAISVSE